MIAVNPVLGGRKVNDGGEKIIPLEVKRTSQPVDTNRMGSWPMPTAFYSDRHGLIAGFRLM